MEKTVVIKIRLPKDKLKEFLASRKLNVSKGILKVLDKYSEEVEGDVLKMFLEERR